MKRTVLLFGIAAIVSVGCINAEKKQASSEENVEIIDSTSMEMDSHNSQNSLDWAGVYEGITPCADCEGIKTILELKNDKTYILSQTYLGKPEGENEIKQTGTFSWDNTGSKVLLKTENGTLQYKVGENQMWMLDMGGNMVEGEMAELYLLKKMGF